MHFALPLRRALTLATLFCVIALPLRLPAAPVDDARQALIAGIEEVSAKLRAQPDQQDLVAILDEAANKHFSFTTTTRLAVGPAWRDFTPEQRTRATELFSRLMVRTYAARIQGETKPDISYGTAVELKAGRMEIPTTVRSGGQNYAVVYRLELDPAAGWRVYDVTAEGVSLIANYRAQFDPLVKKSGAEGLIQSLQTKLAEPVPPPAR